MPLRRPAFVSEFPVDHAIKQSRTAAGAALVSSTILVGLAFGLMSIANAASHSVQIGSATVEPLASVVIELIVVAPSGGIGAYNIDVRYDPTLLSAESCEVGFDSTAAVCNQDFAPDTVRFAGGTALGLTGSVTIGAIGFLAGPNEGTSALSVQVLQITDPEGIDVSFGLEVINGAVSVQVLAATPTATVPTAPTPTATVSVAPSPTVLATLLGDVNCDRVVDAVDATLLLQFDAGLVGTLACLENSDTNGDGRKNSLDAALVLQFSAGLISRLYP